MVPMGSHETADNNKQNYQVHGQPLQQSTKTNKKNGDATKPYFLKMLPVNFINRPLVMKTIFPLLETLTLNLLALNAMSSRFVCQLPSNKKSTRPEYKSKVCLHGN